MTPEKSEISEQEVERIVEQQMAVRDAEIEDYLKHEIETTDDGDMRDALASATVAVGKLADAVRALAVPDAVEAVREFGDLSKTVSDAVDEVDLDRPKRVDMTPADYGMTDDVESALLAMADKRGAARESVRVKRLDLCSVWRQAAERGELPPAPDGRNASYAKRAQFLHAIATEQVSQVGTAAALAMLAERDIKGTNTYSRALRAYRDGLVTRLRNAS